LPINSAFSDDTSRPIWKIRNLFIYLFIYLFIQEKWGQRDIISKTDCRTFILF